MKDNLDDDILIQAGLDLISIMMDMCNNDTHGDVFLKEYLDSLTNVDGIYKKQQDAMEKFEEDNKEIEKVAQEIMETNNKNQNHIEDIRSRFDNLSKTIERFHEKNNELTEKSKEIESQINEINRFIKDIQEISEQTNLLSFNASIEAARAGEAGKGFRIIANEVKKLSDSTKLIASDIVKKIDVLTGHIKGFAEESIQNTRFIDDMNEIAGSSNTTLAEINSDNENNVQSIERIFDGIQHNQANIMTASKESKDAAIEQVQQLAKHSQTNALQLNDRLSLLIEMKQLFNYMRKRNQNRDEASVAEKEEEEEDTFEEIEKE